MPNHQSSHSAIVHKLKWFGKSNLTFLPEVFKSLIQNLKVKCSVNFSRIITHKNKRVFTHVKVENKLFKASVFWVNDSRIHQNMKIARDDSAAKQGRKQTVQGECFLSERQPNSPEHEDRSGWQRRKTRLCLVLLLLLAGSLVPKFYFLLSEKS